MGWEFGGIMRSWMSRGALDGLDGECGEWTNNEDCGGKGCSS
jgi:hypothetical protein